MTAEKPDLRRSIAAFLTLVLQFSAALGVVVSGLWFLVSPRVAPYLDKIEQIDEIVVRLDELERRTPVLNMVAFAPTVEVEPEAVRPGEAVTLRYTARVLFSCGATILVRFWSADRRSFAPRHNREFRYSAQPVGEVFSEYAVTIYLPADIEPGEWRMTAQILPDDDCPALRRVIMPEAHIRVVAP